MERSALAAFDFEDGTLLLTEAGSKKRASLHVVRGRGGARGRSTAAGSRCSTRRSTRSRGADAREPHAQARAHRPAALLRHRQRLLRRDPAPRAAVAGELTRALADEEIARLYEATRASLAEWTERLRAEAARGFPGEGHGVPRGDGGARPLRQAVPRLRRAGAAHRLRRERGELLRDLPDRRQAAGRPRAVAAAAAATGRRRWRSWRNGRAAREMPPTRIRASFSASMFPPETTQTSFPCGALSGAPPRPTSRRRLPRRRARARRAGAWPRRSPRARRRSIRRGARCASGHISSSTVAAADAVHEARRVVDRDGLARPRATAASGAAVSTSQAKTFADGPAPGSPTRCRRRARRRPYGTSTASDVRAGPRGSPARSCRFPPSRRDR